MFGGPFLNFLAEGSTFEGPSAPFARAQRPVLQMDVLRPQRFAVSRRSSRSPRSSLLVQSDLLEALKSRELV